MRPIVLPTSSILGKGILGGKIRSCTQSFAVRSTLWVLSISYCYYLQWGWEGTHTIIAAESQPVNCVRTRRWGKGPFYIWELFGVSELCDPADKGSPVTSTRISALGKGSHTHVTFVHGHMAFITPVRTGTLCDCHSVFVIWYNSEVAKSSTTSSLYKCDHIMPCLLSSASGRQLHILEIRFFSFWHWGLVCSRARDMIRDSWAQTHAFDYLLSLGWIFTTFSISCFSRENDVAGIDVNMGCPKEYSTKVSWVLYTLPKYWVQINED